MSALGKYRRGLFEGWALAVRGAPRPLAWTLRRTRAEARAQLAVDRRIGLLSGLTVDVVRVRVNLELLGEPTYKRKRRA